jgi:hypothetical protein
VKYHNDLTRGEQAIVDLLMRHPRMTGAQIAAALDSKEQSIRVMIYNIRKKGVNLANGGHGLNSKGYKLGEAA